jgi:hypothetical protein
MSARLLHFESAIHFSFVLSFDNSDLKAVKVSVNISSSYSDLRFEMWS